MMWYLGFWVPHHKKLKKKSTKRKIIKTFYATEHKSFEHFFVQVLFWSKLNIPKYKTKTC
jgi:hypothetical protein